MEHQIDKAMTVREIAEYMGMSTQGVYYWVRQNMNLNWHRSTDNRPYALRDEVEEFAKGYLGRRRPSEKAAN